jgi:hypothetical protein
MAGCAAASSPSMPTDWDPCPGKTNAKDIAAPVSGT